MPTYHGSANFFLPPAPHARDGSEIDVSEHLTGDKILFGFARDPIAEKQTTHFISQKITSHFLTVAPTRSGKGVSLIIPNLLYYRGSTVVIDPKGENAWVSLLTRKDILNQKVFILDPWDEIKRRYGDKMQKHFANWNSPETTLFNPLSILNPKDSHYSEDLAYIADSLIINSSADDPFFDDSARELVAGLISYLVESGGDRATLGALRVLLSKPAVELAEIAKNAQNFGYESPSARKLGRFAMPSKTNDSIISTALTQTAFLDSSMLNHAMQGGQGIFDSLVKEPTTIYIVLPVDKLQTFGRWLRLLVSIGIRTVARYADKLPLPVLFMLDEFGTIGKLSAVSQAYGLMAGLNMSVWAFVQDLNQLKHFYPQEWETFIANSQAVSFFNIADQFTAEHFSKMLGTTNIEINNITTSRTNSYSQTQSSSSGSGGDGKSTSGASVSVSSQNGTSTSSSTQHIARRLLLPEEIRQAWSGLGFIIGNHNPYIYNKIAYYREPAFYSVCTPDPHFLESIQRYNQLVGDNKKKQELIESEKVRREIERIKKTFQSNYPSQEIIKANYEKQLPRFDDIIGIFEQFGHRVKVGFFGSISVLNNKGKVIEKFKNKKICRAVIIWRITEAEYDLQKNKEDARLENLAQAEYNRRNSQKDTSSKYRICLSNVLSGRY